MRTITKTVYNYKELTPEAQKKALNKLSDLNVSDSYWYECTYDDAKTIGLKLEGFDIDRGSYCKGKFIEGALDCAYSIEKEHGETCDTYNLAKSFLKERDDLVDREEKDENGEYIDIYGFDNRLDRCEEQFLKDILEEYLSILKKEYEHLTSKACIEEIIEANGYEFDEKGNLV